MKKSRCRYIFCAPGEQPVELDIHNHSEPFDEVYLLYWIRVFQKFEEVSSISGLTFYIVWDYRMMPYLPSYGQDVVAVLLLDEFCLPPRYASRVRFVFKAYGFRPWMSRTLKGKNPVSYFKFARDCARWAYHFALCVRESGVAAARRPGEVIPLGYARQADLPVKPFATRRFSVSFIGSIAQEHFRWWSPRNFIGTPKSIARARMSQSLQRIAESALNEIYFSRTGSFTESILSDGRQYSEIMADTKIALAPRGSSVETYRVFEALRQGCVVICDRLPPHWFYKESPIIQLDDWRDLEAKVNDLLSNQENLMTLHHKSLSWWEAMCSEMAVGKFFSDCISNKPLSPKYRERRHENIFEQTAAIGQAKKVR